MKKRIKITGLLVRRWVRRRFLNGLKRLFVTLLCVIVAVYAAGLFIIPSIVEAQLRELTGAAVQVRSGFFTVPWKIRLHDLLLAGDAEALSDSPILRAEQVDIVLNYKNLLSGQFPIAGVALNGFLVSADYDKDRGEWNFDRLSFGGGASAASGGSLLVKLDGGAVKIRHITEARPTTLTLFSVAGMIAADTNKKTYSFSFHSEGKYGYNGSEVQGLLILGDDTQPGHASLSGRLRMPGARIYNNAWNLENIQLDCGFSPDTIELRTFGFSMGDGDVSVLGGIDVRQQSLTDFHVTLNNLSLAAEFKPDTVVYGQAEKLLGPGLWGFLKRFCPAGSGDIDMTLNGPLNRLSAMKADGMIQCGDISVKDRKFPYLLEHMKGRIHLSGNSMQVGPLVASHGPVELTISGSVENFGPQVAMDVRTTGDAMILDDDLYWAIIKPDEKRLWTWLTPSGVTGIDNRFQRFPDGQKKQTLTLHLKDVSAIYKNFPYPLEHLTGTVLMEGNRIQFENIRTAYADDRSVCINGQIFDFKNPQPTFHIDVDAASIPMDTTDASVIDPLVKAMPSEHRGLFDNLRMDAVGDFRVKLFSKPEAEVPFDYIVTAEVKARTLLYDAFPILMGDVRVRADLTRQVFIVHDFEARTDSGRIALKGQVFPQGTNPRRPGLCLDLDLKQFDLTDAFWQAAGPAAGDMLGKLRLTGRTNIIGHLVQNASPQYCGDNDLVIDCYDDAVLWDANPVGRANGRLVLRADQVFFKNFDFSDVSLDRIPQELMFEKARTLYEWLRPQGSAGIHIADGFMTMTEHGPQQLDVTFRAECDHIAFGPAQMIHELDGDMDGHFMMDRAADVWLTEVACTIEHLSYRDWRVTNCTGAVVYDPNAARLSCKDLKAGFYGGAIEGEFAVDLPAQSSPRYNLSFAYSDIDLRQLLNRDAPPSSESTQGNASGLMMLDGGFETLSESRGIVTSDIRDLKIGRQSLLGNILTAVQLKRPQDFVFHQIEVDAKIAGPMLECERIRMVGDPLIFQGKGTLDLKARTMDLEFVAWDQKIGSEDSFLDMLARGIGSALWRVDMKGDINAPQIDSVYLSVLKQPMNFFQKKSKDE